MNLNFASVCTTFHKNILPPAKMVALRNWPHPFLSLAWEPQKSSALLSCKTCWGSLMSLKDLLLRKHLQKGNEDALRQEIYGINQEVWKLICCLMASRFLNTKTKMVLGVKKFDFYIFVYKRSWVYLSAFKCTFLTPINAIEYLWVQVCSVESNRVKLTSSECR